jgi:hypothetical protein
MGNPPVQLTAYAVAEGTITSFRIVPMLLAVALVSFVSRHTIDDLEHRAIG